MSSCLARSSTSNVLSSTFAQEERSPTPGRLFWILWPRTSDGQRASGAHKLAQPTERRGAMSLHLDFGGGIYSNC